MTGSAAKRTGRCALVDEKRGGFRGERVPGLDGTGTGPVISGLGLKMQLDFIGSVGDFGELKCSKSRSKKGTKIKHP